MAWGSTVMVQEQSSRGQFITVEGGEGSGKSTCIAHLTQALRGKGVDALSVREPGGTPNAERLRALLVSGQGAQGAWCSMSELFLYNAARLEHVHDVIMPALTAGQWVLCDRYSDSTHAYQGYGHGIDTEVVETLHRISGCPKPDLTFILDIPPEIGIRRGLGAQKGEDRYERLPLDFHQRVRDGFLAIAAAHPKRCRVIDAQASATEVWTACLAEIQSKLKSS